MLRMRPFRSADAFSCTREFRVEKAVTRLAPATKSRPIDNSWTRDAIAAATAAP